MSACLIQDVYPDLIQLAPNTDSLWHINKLRCNFIQESLCTILNAKLTQPFLRRIITRFIKREEINANQDNIMILSKQFISKLWQICNKLPTGHANSFKQHLKITNNKMPRVQRKFTNRLQHIVLPLFAEAKNPKHIANVELMQYAHAGKFNMALAIANFKARIEFALNFQHIKTANMIPVVFASARYTYEHIKDINKNTLERARHYYLVDILKTYFKKPFLARMEIGVQEDWYYWHNLKDYTSSNIHVHAFVDKDEYAEFLKHAKHKRADARAQEHTSHLLKLKCKKLVSMQAEQTNSDYLDRQLNYASKFAILESQGSTKEAYNSKASRLDFAQEFHSRQSAFINEVILPNYTQGLLYRKTTYLSYEQLSKHFLWDDKHLYSDEPINTLIGVYKSLLELETRLNKLDQDNLGILDILVETVLGPVMDDIEKIELVTRPVNASTPSKFKQIPHKIIKLLWQKYKKPPD